MLDMASNLELAIHQWDGSDMNIKVLIASVLGLSAAGTGGYFLVTNDVAVEVNVSPGDSQSVIATDDFRKLIPNYENLSVWDKGKAIKEVYDALPAEQKIAANRELTALGEEANKKVREGFGEQEGKGHTPLGWE